MRQSVLPDRTWRIHQSEHEVQRGAWIRTRPHAHHALDVGCGFGFHTIQIPASIVMGIDINPSYITEARKFIRDNGSSVIVRTGNAYDIPFADNCYDAVYCMETLEHLESPEDAARELERVSRNRIYVTVPAFDCMTETAGHVQNFTAESLADLFTDVIEVVERTPFLYLTARAKGDSTNEETD